MRKLFLVALFCTGLASSALSADESTIFDDGQECMAGDKLLLVPFEIARTYSAQCKELKVDEYGQTYLFRAKERPVLNKAEARLLARIAFYGKPDMAKAACGLLGNKGKAARDFWNKLKKDGVCR